MAGKITDLGSIPAVNRSTNVMEIADVSGNASYKVTPNALLGLSGNPIGDTDSQTLTNKTLTAPTISSPILSGTLTGTYTLAGTPTFPATVVTTTGSQTLTNKTLTSPTLTSPTLTNASITTDAITGFTTANSGSIYGLAISGATIGAAGLASGAVTSSKLSLDFVEATLAASFSSTAANTWQDTGFNITLPTAGTWLVMTDIRSDLPATSGSFVAFRYYNTTAAAAVANSERLGALNNAASGLQNSMPLTMRITTAAANTVIRLDIQPGGAYICKVDSDSNGRSHMMAFRIAA